LTSVKSEAAEKDTICLRILNRSLLFLDFYEIAVPIFSLKIDTQL